MPNPVVKTLTVDGVTYNLKDIDSDSFAPKASPALTGTPTTPTALVGTDTTQIANTAFVQDTIEDKTDLVISVGEIGTAIAGQSVIGTDSTNFPTSKAVVTYVENRLGEAAERDVDEDIPIATVGEAVVGDPVGTISRNLPTSKAVVEYVEEFVEDYIDNAIPTEVTVDAVSMVGLAQVGVAITDKSNYTPQGNVVLSMNNQEIIANVEVDYSYNNYILSINGITCTSQNVLIPNSASFEGASVKLVVK